MNIKADLVLYNANVITLNSSMPRATLVAICGNHIAAVGKDDILASICGPHTKCINCEGKTIVPGFNDAHCHPLSFATRLLNVDCSPTSAKSIPDIIAQIRRKAKDTPEGHWIRASAYNEFYLAEQRHPTRWDIDEATRKHPVRLSHRSGHACVLNSMAMELAGISSETAEPDGGMFDRDLETGEPNGILFGMNNQIQQLMPQIATNDFEKSIRIATQQYLSHGITSLQDASWDDSSKRWQTFKHLKENNRFPCRVSMMIGIESLEWFQERDYGPCEGDANLRLGAVKIVVDRIRSSLNPPQEKLNAQVYKAHQLGFQVALHAVEEITIKAAAVAIERAVKNHPRHGHRHRLEHCCVCPRHLAQQLKSIEVMVVTQPCFIYFNGERYIETVPHDQLEYIYSIGSLDRNDLLVASSSDSPIVPLNPLIGIYAAVTGKAETGQILSTHETISPQKALESYTLAGAYASFEESIKGSITCGKLADLAILSDDPTSVPSEQIKKIQVVITIIDGKVVWNR